MKTVSPELLALLNNSTKFLMADLLTVTMVGGEILRYSSADSPAVAWNGQTFNYISWERTKTKIVRGLEVDTLDLIFYPKVYPVSAISEMEEDQILGMSFLKALRLGAWEGATIQLEQAFFSGWWDEIVGTLIKFTGQVAPFEYDGGAKVTVKSDLEICNRELPRNLYQPGCLNTLYDASCGLNKASWAATGSVVSASSSTVINSTLAQADGYFDLGVLEFTSGSLDGQRRTVKSYAAGVITLAAPLVAAPAAGDTFTTWPGCNKSMDSCQNKFSNLDANSNLKYRGFPYIPKPESLL